MEVVLSSNPDLANGLVPFISFVGTVLANSSYESFLSFTTVNSSFECRC